MPSSRRLRVYIAAPYSKGDIGMNVNNAMVTWDMLFTQGYIPYCPHWTHFQHVLLPRAYQEWLFFDVEWLLLCDVVLRLQGESSGADSEVKFAQASGMPVVFTIEELLKEFPPDGNIPPRTLGPA